MSRADELRARSEEIHVIDARARPVLVRQSRRERGLDCLPRHALRENGKRVAKIDHLIEAAAEEILGGQCAKPRSDRCGKLSGSAGDYSSFWALLNFKWVARHEG